MKALKANSLKFSPGRALSCLASSPHTMEHLISAHNKSPAGDVASVRIVKQKGNIIRQNRSRIKINDIVFPEKYFREAIIMKPDIKTGIPTTGFYELVN